MMKAIQRLCLSCLLIMVGCQTAQDETARLPEEPSSSLRIAYNVAFNEEIDDYEIFSMNLDGSDKKNISNWEGVDWVYASHGDRIFFLSDRDNEHRKYNLYEMDAHGNHVRRINDFILADSWITSRKGGREFLVTSKKEGKKAFYLIDEEGAELAQVFSDTIRFNDPCFSPDGSQVAFRYHRSGHDEIWLINTDGTGLTQLTHYPPDQMSDHPHFYHAGPPRWESNRNIISYISYQDGSYDIYTMNPNGSNHSQITANNWNHGWHDWSPDGTAIVCDGSDLDNKNFDIYIMNADGSEVRRLTTDSLFEQAPVFVATDN